ncbi:hypothetical protein ACFRFL_14045 [Streptomyces sp. NPDC056708]|uniref:hypothetical protein n=1 Tax=unclassified Streptomyces TaxID=2593676 RepID=UPI0036C281E8
MNLNTPQGNAAQAFGNLVEEVDARRDAITVHRFHTTLAVRTAAALDELGDGDVFVVEAEGVTGFIVGTVPAAVTEQRGELPHLTSPGREFAGGLFVDSVVVAEREARGLGLAIRDEAIAPLSAGDRVICPDGSARSVTDTTRSNGHLWISDENGAGWRADRCEKVDTTNVPRARAEARKAAAILRHPVRKTDSERTEAVDILGDALCYLAQADPAALDELHEESTARITVDVPRLNIAPGDIVHHHGARLTVLETGISTNSSPQWWAKLHGVTDADRRATYRAPWNIGLSTECAAWDVVTIERILPALPAA